MGPIWQGGDRREDDLLAARYRNSLALAVQHGARSIAFPAISTGAYGFPLERATRIAVTEIRHFLEQDTTIEAVVLVCFGRQTAEVARATLEDLTDK